VLVAAAAPSSAAVAVTAELDHARVSLDGSLVLAVTVSGDATFLPDPKLPPIESFSLYASGKNSSISIVNGRVTSSAVYTYVLTPRALGRFTIPAIAADGATPSLPIAVEVVKSAPPAPDAPAPDAPGMPAPPAGPQPVPAPDAARPTNAPGIVVVAAFDKPRALVNEQVTLTVRFLYSETMRLVGDSQYEPPVMTGFLAEDLPPVRNGVMTYDGRQYAFSEIKTALFPIQAGKLTIGPATVHAQVARPVTDPFGSGFLDSFFATAQRVAVRSEPLTLQVDPPPPGKPADFTGLVGRLTARASADRTEVKTGDAVTLTVELSGEGNVKSIPEPAAPNLPSLRFFEPESSAAVEKTGDRVGGRKTFRTVVVPRVSGAVTLPAYGFSYYDPQRRAYERAETSPLTLHVAPGPAGAGAAVAGPAPAAPGVTPIAEDIRYLKTAPERAPLSAGLSAFADLGPWHAAPLAVLALAALFDWRRRAADSDPRGRRFRDARRRAEERLSAAARLPDPEAARAAALVDEALAAFVADKLDVPPAGLTLKAALDGLRGLKRAPSAPSLESLRSVWEEAALRRFAPGGADSDARRFADEALHVIRALDQEIAR
jgi:hypothetical protein